MVQKTHRIRVVKTGQEHYVPEKYLRGYGLILKDWREKGKLLMPKCLSNDNYQYIGLVGSGTETTTEDIKNVSLFDSGLPENSIEALADAGYNSLIELVDLSIDDLVNIKGIGPRSAKTIRELIDNG